MDKRERVARLAEMLDLQGGKCAVCGSDGPLDLDHDHETWLVRGYLCSGCNIQEAVGDSPALAAYRANPPGAPFQMRYVGQRRRDGYGWPKFSDQENHDAVARLLAT